MTGGGEPFLARVGYEVQMKIVLVHPISPCRPIKPPLEMTPIAKACVRPEAPMPILESRDRASAHPHDRRLLYRILPKITSFG
jgi:hypothetical protein